ncbi:MAG: RNA polymerase sigma factor [Planctomycetales bacterium]|nr:RNA polymerase sigma factor [Planctomycetales bacterium]
MATPHPTTDTDSLIELSDEELWRRVQQASDASAFAIVHKRYASRVAAVVARFCRASADIDSVCQEVWLKAWLNCSQYRHESNLGGWLMAIARSKAIDRQRQLSRTRETTLAGEWNEPVADDKHATLNPALAAAKECLETLRNKKTQVWQLRLQGVGDEEIAARLNVASVGTIYRYASEAKKSIHDCVRAKLR